MVCPNCHSKEVIAVQDQHFCINCGQVVPEEPLSPPVATPHVAVQENGLPEGVKILPVTPAAPEVVLEGAKRQTAAGTSIITARPRMVSLTDEPESPKLKKRPPGRPKAGRLDVPRPVGSLAPTPPPAKPVAVPLPPAPQIARPPLPTPPPRPVGPRQMSDIAPRRRPAVRHAHAAPTKPEGPPPKKAARVPKRPAVHKVGVPPLHYGAIVAFSLRARVRPRLVGLASAGAICFAAAVVYGVWLLVNGGLPHLAAGIMAGGAHLVAEAALLAVLYYIGRSIGQAAIVYGVTRQSDQRPVTLSHQVAVGINTFGRRLKLDLAFGLLELFLLGLVAALLLTGGESWPVNLQIQVAALFAAFMVLLYLLTSLAVARGLAGVALTLTPEKPWRAAKFGWRLFSHRFELLGLRFAAAAMELILSVPLAVLAVAFVAAAPDGARVYVTLGVGLLAWLAGAMFGAGTASWWAALYHRLVLLDHPDGAVMLLSGNQPQIVRTLPLVLLVTASSFLIAATIALPWLKLP